MYKYLNTCKAETVIIKKMRHTSWTELILTTTTGQVQQLVQSGEAEKTREMALNKDEATNESTKKTLQHFCHITRKNQESAISQLKQWTLHGFRSEEEMIE